MTHTTALTLSASPNIDRPISVFKLTRDTWQAPRAKVFSFLFFEGTAEFGFAQERLGTEASEVVLLPPGSSVKVLAAKQPVWRVSFQLELLNTLASGLGDVYKGWHALGGLSSGGSDLSRYHVEDAALWSSTLTALSREVNTQDLGYCETSKAYLSLLAVQLARLARQELASTEAIENPLIAKVMAHINSSYAESISLSQVAETFHHSPAYLTTLFKKETGTSLGSCIIERRIEEAKRLLEHSSLSVAAIGERVGYPEPSQFSRLFRKRVGVLTY